jgi:hypothetical protein
VANVGDGSFAKPGLPSGRRDQPRYQAELLCLVRFVARNKQKQDAWLLRVPVGEAGR